MRCGKLMMSVALLSAMMVLGGAMPTTVARFVGNWSGTWEQGENGGTMTLAIAADGTFRGRYMGDSNGRLRNGRVQPNGSATVVSREVTDEGPVHLTGTFRKHQGNLVGRFTVNEAPSEGVIVVRAHRD